MTATGLESTTTYFHIFPLLSKHVWIIKILLLFFNFSLLNCSWRIARAFSILFWTSILGYFWFFKIVFYYLSFMYLSFSFPNIITALKSGNTSWKTAKTFRWLWNTFKNRSYKTGILNSVNNDIQFSRVLSDNKLPFLDIIITNHLHLIISNNIK